LGLEIPRASDGRLLIHVLKWKNGRICVIFLHAIEKCQSRIKRIGQKAEHILSQGKHEVYILSNWKSQMNGTHSCFVSGAGVCFHAYLPAMMATFPDQ
jgi:hypothetical protein